MDIFSTKYNDEYYKQLNEVNTDNLVEISLNQDEITKNFELLIKILKEHHTSLVKLKENEVNVQKNLED